MQRIFKLLLLPLLLAPVFLAAQSSAQSAQPKQSQPYQEQYVTDKFFPDPDVVMDVPAFKKDSGFTNYREMNAFLWDLATQYPDRLSVEYIGKTTLGNFIPMVKIAKDDGKDKLRVFYYARLHGSEPSGSEAMLFFIKQMCAESRLAYLLDQVEYYVIPMLNIDGAEKNTRETSLKQDINRDNTKLENPEAALLHQAFNRVKPHFLCDFHEFGSYKGPFDILTETKDRLFVPWDVMFIWSTNPNIYPGVMNMAETFIEFAFDEVKKCGYTSSRYYTAAYGKNRQSVNLTVGGGGLRTSTGVTVLKNCVSVLMETRRSGFERISLKRRAHTQYVLAERFAREAYDRREEIKKVVNQANATTPKEIAVAFNPELQETETLLLNQRTNELQSFKVGLYDLKNYKITLSRKTPLAYYILPGMERAEYVMEQQGVEFTRLKEPLTLELESYTVTKANTKKPDTSGTSMKDVKTEVSTKTVTLPAGTLRVGMEQPYRRLAAVLIEPETSGGFVNFQIIPSEEGKELPIYRQMK